MQKKKKISYWQTIGFHGSATRAGQGQFCLLETKKDIIIAGHKHSATTVFPPN